MFRIHESGNESISRDSLELQLRKYVQQIICKFVTMFIASLLLLEN